jgi:uncharacterized membrane protein YidH (DUF202 family)
VKKILISLGLMLASGLPSLVLARDAGYLTELIKQGKTLLDNLIVFLIALAVVWFIWNVIKYTMSDDEEKKGAAKSQMIWGIVAIAVIVSIWGLVGILQTMFGAGGQTANDAGSIGDLLPQY